MSSLIPTKATMFKLGLGVAAIGAIGGAIALNKYYPDETAEIQSKVSDTFSQGINITKNATSQFFNSEVYNMTRDVARGVVTNPINDTIANAIEKLPDLNKLAKGTTRIVEDQPKYVGSILTFQSVLIVGTIAAKTANLVGKYCKSTFAATVGNVGFYAGLVGLGFSAMQYMSTAYSAG